MKREAPLLQRLLQVGKSTREQVNQESNFLFRKSLESVCIRVLGFWDENAFQAPSLLS